MDRRMREEQADERADKAKGGDIGIGTGDIAGTNVPDNTGEGTGTPEQGGKNTGESGVTRTSAAPGETEGFGSRVKPGPNEEEEEGGYGSGKAAPKERGS